LFSTPGQGHAPNIEMGAWGVHATRRMEEFFETGFPLFLSRYGPQNVETFVFPQTAYDRGCFKQVSQCRPQAKRNATCLCEGTAPVCSICHVPLVGETGVPRTWHPKWLVSAKLGN
jgi:hypothetical protein